MAYGLMGLAVVVARAQPVHATRLLEVAEALREAAGVTIWPPRRTLYDDALQTVHAALGAAALDVAWAEGRAMTLERAVEYALQSDRAGSVPTCAMCPPA